MLQPICSAVFTLACFRACASVLTHMKSTPSMPAVTMCATALPPPPPTPITLMTALWLYASISSNMLLLLERIKGWLSLRSHVCQLQNLSASKITLEPGTHALEHRLAVGAERMPAACGHQVVAREQQQSHAGRVNRIPYHVGEPGDRLRDAEAHRHVEHFLGELDRAFH